MIYEEYNLCDTKKQSFLQSAALFSIFSCRIVGQMDCHGSLPRIQIVSFVIGILVPTRQKDISTAS